MSAQLRIAVTFLTGRYHGEEWPPSPARLFQALLGGVMTCGYQRHAAIVESALRWLERQPPPSVYACEADDLQRYRIAVPNNDMDVVAWEWMCGRQADPAKIKTMKEIGPRELQRAGPHVQYCWQVDAGEGAAMSQALELAANCLHTLGWGIDMAFAEMDGEAQLTDAYEPAISGTPVAIPMPGTLDDLHRTYERFSKRASGTGVDTHTRPAMIRVQPYRRAGDVVRPLAGFMLMQPEADQTKAVAWENCMKVAGWLRHAAAKALDGEYDAAFIEEYVQGHTKEGTEDRRLSYVPIPSIYRFNDGMIRRALIVEPPGAAGEVVRMLQFKLAGRVLDGTSGRECCLAPAPRGDWTFEQYSAEGKVWRTVTPVVLHGFNTDGRGKISVTKTERLLLRAFEMAGYPETVIEGFGFQAGPWLRSTKHAAAMRTPSHLNGFPRMHVEVRFRRKMRGPVLAGIGRHYGIGLFAKAA